MTKSRSVIEWFSDTEFAVNGYRFVLDYQHGGSNIRSEAQRFLMMKGPRFLEHYTSLDPNAYDNVIELGVFQGGSFVFLDQLLRPRKFAAVELGAVPITALDDYISRTQGRCQVHYGMSQDDEEALKRIVRDDFGGSLDLVVDDASHFYKETKASFEILFPLMRPGGLYIIEDWGWAFQDDSQSSTHVWHSVDSPANLVVDLMEDMTRGSLIRDVRIFPDLLMVQRSEAEAGKVFGSQARRGRQYRTL